MLKPFLLVIDVCHEMEIVIQSLQKHIIGLLILHNRRNARVPGNHLDESISEGSHSQIQFCMLESISEASNPNCMLELHV